MNVSTFAAINELWNALKNNRENDNNTPQTHDGILETSLHCSLHYAPAWLHHITYVKIIYLRNLDVSETPEMFQTTILRFVAKKYLEKVYKFKNYAFIHLQTREIAENLMDSLREYYKGTPVEVTWSKPPNKYTTQEYRQRKVSSLSIRSPSRPGRSLDMANCQWCTTTQPCTDPHDLQSATEQAEEVWQHSPWINELSTGQPILYHHEVPSSTISPASLSSSVSPLSPASPVAMMTGFNGDLFNYLAEAIKQQTQQKPVTEMNISVATSLNTSPVPLSQTLLKCVSPAPPTVPQQYKLDQNAIASITSLMNPEEPVAGPSYTPLLETSIPEGIDPIKEYQRKMRQIFDPKKEVFDIENMKREMELMPRHTTFQNVRHYVGDILDNLMEDDDLDLF